MKSLTVLKPGGRAIGVTGPPDAGFAKQLGAPKPFEFVLSFLSRKVRRAARKLGVRYSFFFMHASGTQLRELAALYEAGHLRPVIDSTFPFDQTLEALAYVENGKAKAGESRHHARPTRPDRGRHRYSQTTSSGVLSGRSPRQLGWRNRWSVVRSL